MKNIRSVCVYCGSGPGSNPSFIKAAHRFGAILAENDVRLVYGGGSVGMMGAVAASAMQAGGKVTGIIPEFLIKREKPMFEGYEVIVTPDMHTRKQAMFEHADAFVALPGGVGTLEELVEQMTWAQLGRHQKPILVANIDGFWNPLTALLDHMTQTQFIRPGLAIRLLSADDIEDVLPKLEAASVPVSPQEEARVSDVVQERM